MAETIDAYLKDVRISAEMMTVPLVSTSGGALKPSEIAVAIDEAPPPRQVSFATGNEALFQRSLDHWIDLDVAEAQPCSHDIMEAAKAINCAFLAESTDADMVLTNLPDLLNAQSALGYCQVLEQIARGLKRVLLVHESTKNIITRDN
eukprot:CAMPEP_0204121658 /NCGR_PEP_ID=MMETSP0361-20130328/8322_1 /ASSEMBLY_ACC=CAM_ASM_000343 /TAXON_ID=268821 /ORGANISM="Scrippsiella Hangoei, Strain SHTV-5" /LENGTH=147 /DNA_ID=CAMNT_0051072973 /DNA_START=9 /DNA_END=452 /DNA_ORIENTATION=-